MSLVAGLRLINSTANEAIAPIVHYAVTLRSPTSSSVQALPSTTEAFDIIKALVRSIVVVGSDLDNWASFSEVIPAMLQMHSIK